MIQLWKSLVVVHLDYCRRLWKPKRKREINKLETHQENFTRRITGVPELDLFGRLKKIPQQSLETKRERFYVFQFLENLVPNVTTH